MFEDSLVCIPIERWNELQDVFKKDWPRGISAFRVLETLREFTQNGFDCGFKVFSPFGDVNNGMVAFNDKEQSYEVIIQCPRGQTEKLEDALIRTKILNWQRPVAVPFAQYHVIECLQRALGDHVKVDMLPAEIFIFDQPGAFEDTQLPPGMSLGLITLQHLDVVNSTWPHRHANSRSAFQLLINMKFGYGLFLENELVTWVFVNEYGILRHLYTVHNHRQKGYAELILRLICNILIKTGKPVLAACVTDNLNAGRLYRKLEFKKLFPVARAFVNKTAS